MNIIKYFFHFLESHRFYIGCSIFSSLIQVSIFRWFLLLFKNEFSLTDIFSLWDVLFAQHITTHMEIFIACSILVIYKEQVRQLAVSTIYKNSQLTLTI